MDALILSCGTGGGHNTAAKAIKEEFIKRGCNATLLNPYTLCSKKTARVIDKAYVSLVQKCPNLFGFIYQLGSGYRRLPFRSPVYFANKRASKRMSDYLKKRKFDIIITTHLFPAEIITQLKYHGEKVPLTVFVSTDYECTPFVEETKCDAFVIPGRELIDSYTSRGIEPSILYPLGIPVPSAFNNTLSQSDAKKKLGLLEENDYLLLSGGSMGAGKLFNIAGKLYNKCKQNEKLIVICGTNEKLYNDLLHEFGNSITLIKCTDKMAEYIRASKMYFTKPGGLSSTEAAVSETVLVHLPPIPGCETLNAKFYANNGMSIRFKNNDKGILDVMSLLNDSSRIENMKEMQRQIISKKASKEIYELAQHIVDKQAQKS